MAKASKKQAPKAPKKKSKYHTPIKIQGSPDEVLKALLTTTPKSK